MTKLTLFIICCFLAQSCRSEFVRWQGFEIHYTTFNSTLIPSDVAEAHGIIRSKRRIITNVTIRRQDKAIRARVRGTTRNLLSQLFIMEFEEVSETGAIYYLANQIIDDRDTLMFSIDIKPADQDDTYHLKFTRQYFQ